MRKAWRRLAARRFQIGVVLAVTVLLVLAGLLQASIDSSGPAAAWGDSSPFASGKSLLDVLGGVRQTLAAYLWTRQDTLFHTYFEHSLGHDQSLFSYYWLISRLDPHFTMAYYYASWMLCRFGNVQGGFDLAMEGVRENPESPLLQDNLAAIYLYFLKDPAKASYHNQKAIDLELAKPPDQRDTDQLFVYQKFQNLIDQIIAGERKIPKVIPMRDIQRLSPEDED